LPAAIGAIPFAIVRFDPVKSADPPTSSGVTGAIASRNRRLAARVASFGRSSARSCFSAATASCQVSGSRPAMTRSNSARWLCRASRFSQDRRATAPRVPTACQRCFRSSGMENGGSVQCSSAFAPAASASPSGEPCAAPVPAFSGAPKPMMVRQAISVGFFDRTAKDKADWICAGSCPSTCFVAQP